MRETTYIKYESKLNIHETLSVKYSIVKSELLAFMLIKND